MAYQTAKKRQESVPPMAGNHNVDAAAAAPKIAGGAYGLEQPSLGSDLEAQMQARIARFQSRQNPVAEQEADTIAEGIYRTHSGGSEGRTGRKDGGGLFGCAFPYWSRCIGPCGEHGSAGVCNGA